MCIRDSSIIDHLLITYDFRITEIFGPRSRNCQLIYPELIDPFNTEFGLMSLRLILIHVS